MIKIISDSTSDLSKELIEKYNIDILPLYIHMDDMEYKDGIDITPDEIYEWSEKNKSTPKTAAPSIEDAINAILPYKEKGMDIIMFAISEDMSTSANVMRLAAEELDYTEHTFVIDSANLSTGIGHLVVEAAIMAKKEMPAKKIVENIEALKPYVRASFVVDTLTYLHRGGRCSSTAALVGNALKLKPRIFVKNGKMEAGHKYRGKQSRVILQYVKDMEKELLKAKKDRVFITHSGCPQEVIDKVKDYLKGLNHFKRIIVTRAGGVISSHCGAGTLGVLFIAGEEKFGPYDKRFDKNRNGIMEPDEKAEEAAYIRYVMEKEKQDCDEEEEQ
jgi:DegV family protein with EDD domain